MSRRTVPRVLRLAAHTPATENTDAPDTGRARAALALVPPPPARPTPPNRPPSQPRPSRPPRAAMILVASALVAGAVGGWSSWAGAESAAADEAGRSGLGAAVSAAEAILSYDHAHIDADVAAATQRTTGPFRTEYADTTRTLTPMAKQYKAVVKADVKAGSVVRADADEVVTLLFVDQSTRSTRVSGTKVDQARVRLTMRKVQDGQWRVAKVDAL